MSDRQRLICIRAARGITLLEILGAMLILAVAFIPIIGVISSGSADTDVTNSYIFAQTTARNILNTVLDNVPFQSIRVSSANVADIGDSNSEPNVGEIIKIPKYEDSVASFLEMIGNPGGDYFARGQLVDERNTQYKIKLFVFPVPAYDYPDWQRELCFRYLPRPDYENHVDFSKKPDWYTTNPDDKFVKAGVPRPYDDTYLGITVKKENAKSLGASAGPDGSFCIMKRLLLRIRWKMPKGGERSLEIYTTKANLSRED